MDSESTPIVKLIAGAVGLVVVCFCVGFFLLGGRSSSGSAAPVAASQPDSTPSPLSLEGGDSPRLSVVETSERKPSSAPGSLRVADARSAGEASPAPKASPKAAPSPVPSDTSEGAAGVGAGKPSKVKPRTSGGDAVLIPAPHDDTTEASPRPEATEPDDSAPSGDPGSLYRVRVKNSFGSHDDADQLASELKGRGFAATVMPTGKGKFQVQIGAYKDKKRAEEKQKELEKNNYDTHISDKNADSDGDKAEKSEPEKSDKSAKKEEGEKKSGDG